MALGHIPKPFLPAIFIKEKPEVVSLGYRRSHLLHIQDISSSIVVGSVLVPQTVALIKESEYLPLYNM